MCDRSVIVSCHHSSVPPARQTPDGQPSAKRRPPKWVAWLLVAAASTVTVLACLAWVVDSIILKPIDPDPGLRQAIALRLGVDPRQLGFERIVENDGCTIAEVSAHDDYRSVAARRHGAGWAITKVSSDTDHFDLDDPQWERVCASSP